RSGVTIIYSTHYMEEVETLCDTVAIIDEGEVKAYGTLGHLLEQYGRHAIFLEAENMLYPPALSDITKTYKEGSGWILETDALGEVMNRILEQAPKESWQIK